MSKKKLTQAFTILLAGVAVQRLANIFFIGIVTVVLAPADYSLFGLFSSLVVLMTVPLSLGLPQAPPRVMFDFDEGNSRNSFIRSSWLACGGIVLLLSLVALPLVGLIHIDMEQLFHSPFNWILFGSVVCNALIELSRATLRGMGSILLYTITGSLKHVLILGFVYIFHSFQNLDLLTTVNSYFLSLLIATAFGSGVILSKTQDAKIDFSVIKPALVFGFPFVFQSIFGWTLMNSGKWIGSHALGLEMMAPYFFVMQVQGVVGMLPRSLYEVRTAEIGNAISKKNIGQGKRVVRKTALLGLTLILLTYLGVYFGFEVLGFQKWIQFHIPMDLLLLSLVLSCIDLFYLYGFQMNLLWKNTKALAGYSALGSLLVAVLGYFLVKAMGTPAALIYASMIGFSFLSVAFIVSAKRVGRKTKA